MNSKLLNLMGILVEQTEAQKVQWERLDDTMYRTSIGYGLFRIGRGDDIYRQCDEFSSYSIRTYNVWILNKFGHIAQEERIAEDETGFAVADGLFRAARSASAKTDDVVNDMIATLIRN